MSTATQNDVQPVSYNRLPSLLACVGVGSKWSLRDLESASRFAVDYKQWQQMAQRLPPGTRRKRFRPETLRGAHTTLKRLGADLTYGQLEQAALSDEGYESPDTVKNDTPNTLKAAEITADTAISVLAGLPPDQLKRAVLDLMTLAEQHQRLDVMRDLMDLVARAQPGGNTDVVGDHQNSAAEPRRLRAER